MGLASVLAARVAGASRIIAVDRFPARLRLASEFGATHTLLAIPGETSSDISGRIK